MTKTNAFDFASINIAAAADQPYEFELVYPPTHPHEGEGLGVFVSVIGAESAEFQRYIREEANQAQLANFRKRRSSKPDAPLSIEEQEAKITEAIARAVKGWRTVIDGKSEPVIYDGGAPVEFSAKACADWMMKYPFVRDQINQATADLSNFIKA